MAEGLAKKILGEKTQIESAGSHPGQVNPIAIQVMDEMGIDIRDQYSKAVEDLLHSFSMNLDLVITLCAEEVCPAILTKAKKLHWPMPDPVNPHLPKEAQLVQFRAVRDAIGVKIEDLAKSLGPS